MAVEHDYYADPTIFDHLYRRALEYTRKTQLKFKPYAWSTGFAGLALVIAVVLCVIALLMGNAVSEGAPDQLLPRGVLLLTGLLVIRSLLIQAVCCFPVDSPSYSSVRESAAFLIGAAPPVCKSVHASAAPRSPATPPVTDVKAFFATVRAAGVNVSIARALFDAGVRDRDSLLASADEHLLHIRGVGPATVRKLRIQFSNQDSGI